MSDQYNVFKTTNLYINFESAICVELSDVEIDEMEWYQNLLTNLKNVFKCFAGVPSEDQLTSYIKNNETNIDAEHIPEFILLIKKVFEKLFAINKGLVKMKTKLSKSTKDDLKKNAIQTQKKIEQLKNKESAQNIKVLVKEANEIKKQKLLDFNKEIIECEDCGDLHPRFSTDNHRISNRHILRLEGATWAISKHSVTKYL